MGRSINYADANSGRRARLEGFKPPSNGYSPAHPVATPVADQRYRCSCTQLISAGESPWRAPNGGVWVGRDGSGEIRRYRERRPAGLLPDA